MQVVAVSSNTSVKPVLNTKGGRSCEVSGLENAQRRSFFFFFF